MPIPATAPLLPRQELFAHHVASGASLAQAARLAGYSPQGARQRGSLPMANSDICIRVEKLRRASSETPASAFTPPPPTTTRPPAGTVPAAHDYPGRRVMTKH